MKRAITVLILSLFAFPLFAQGEQSTKFQCVSLEHVQGAWRMQIKCEQGAGAISLSDTRPSDFATYPIVRNADRKNWSPIAADSESLRRRASAPELLEYSSNW